MTDSDTPGDFLNTLRTVALSARRKLLEQTIDDYAARARSRVQAMREKHPEWSDSRVADQLIGEAASQAASVGASVAMPGVFVGPGTAISVALSGPEVAWLLRQQVRLSLEIGDLYGKDAADREARIGEMEEFFPSAFRAVHTGNTATQLMISTLARLGRKRAAMILGSMAAATGLLLRRGAFFRRLPLMGIPIAALVNAMAIQATGNEAKQRYGQVAIAVVDPPNGDHAKQADAEQDEANSWAPGSDEPTEADESV